ncbi:uncharacterized protein TNCV_2274851 [Trichonephila clavipes]|nr:uncharacterized protein TNCV_2274851 [Trichonephila clavipes]
MKQLAVRVHFLRCGGLLDDWSVEGVLSLVFVEMRSLGSTSSQYNQSGLIEELLIKADLPASIMPMILPPLELRQLLILSSKTA